MGAALWRRLEESAVRVLAPARVRGMQSVDGRQRIECDLGPQGSASVETKLAIAADGAQSALREAAGIGAQTWNYEQTALVTQRPHAALPRPCGVRALHAVGPAGAAADVRRAAWA